MRTALIIFLLSAASTASAATVLLPTGDPALDVANIQAAANVGGEIVLRARDVAGNARAFEFGATGRVLFNHDVIIRGESHHGVMATIHGGSQTFLPRCDVDPTTFLCLAQPPRFVVHNVRFDANLYDGIRVIAASYVEITDCLFTNTQGGPIGDETKGQGIWVGGASYPLENVGGQMIIADNEFRDIHADLAYGIALFGFSANTTVRHNKIRGANTAGIGLFVYSGAVVVEHNDIRPGPGTSPLESSGNGLYVTQFEIFDLPGELTVRHNKVECVNPNADGLLFGLGVHDVEVVDNDVTMRGSLYSGITVGLGADRTFVAHNKISGDGAYALAVVGAIYDYPTPNIGNTFVDNDIKHFTSSFADIFLDESAVDTFLEGKLGNVVDNGVNTTIIEHDHGHHGPGHHAHDGHHGRHAAAHE